MSPTALRRLREAGMTIVEMTISSAVLVVVLSIAATAILRAQRNASGVAVRVETERRSSAGIERLTSLLGDCAGSTVAGNVAPPSGASSMTFRDRIGWSGGSVVYGELTTIQWLPDPLDAQNGIDDDRDGLVDEGRVVWQAGSGGTLKSAVLIQNVANRLEGEIGGNNLDDNGNGLVDERGLSFVLEDGRLTIRLTIERRERDGTTRRETSQSELRIDD